MKHKNYLSKIVITFVLMGLCNYASAQFYPSTSYGDNTTGVNILTGQQMGNDTYEANNMIFCVTTYADGHFNPVSIAGISWKVYDYLTHALLYQGSTPFSPGNPQGTYINYPDIALVKENVTNNPSV